MKHSRILLGSLLVVAFAIMSFGTHAQDINFYQYKKLSDFVTQVQVNDGIDADERTLITNASNFNSAVSSNPSPCTHTVYFCSLKTEKVSGTTKSLSDILAALATYLANNGYPGAGVEINLTIGSSPNQGVYKVTLYAKENITD